MTTAAYRIAVGAYLGLFALLMAWIVRLAPPPAALITPALLIVVGPLLLALPGVLRRRRYTLAWSTLLILAYFVHGVVYAAGAGPQRWLGAVEVILALTYFTAATAYLRLSRTPRQPTPSRPEPSE